MGIEIEAHLGGTQGLASMRTLPMLVWCCFFSMSACFLSCVSRGPSKYMLGTLDCPAPPHHHPCSPCRALATCVAGNPSPPSSLLSPLSCRDMLPHPSLISSRCKAACVANALLSRVAVRRSPPAATQEGIPCRASVPATPPHLKCDEGEAAMRAVTFPHHLHVCHRPECLCKVRTQLRLILVGCTTNEDLRVNADESVLAHMLAD